MVPDHTFNPSVVDPPLSLAIPFVAIKDVAPIDTASLDGSTLNIGVGLPSAFTVKPVLVKNGFTVIPVGRY